MLSNTKGIVLQYLKYSESSIITRIFTEEFGLQSYIVKGVRSKRSKFRLALFQPLTLLDIVAYHKDSQSLHHLKEVSVAFPYQHIPQDVVKGAVLLFLNEILIKSLREEHPDKALFNWLFDALTWFDLTDKKITHFHLLLMIQLSRFLGFYPKKTRLTQQPYFDLQGGEFTEYEPHHPDYLSGILVQKLEDLLNCNFESIESLEITKKERMTLLDAMVVYYRLHVPGFGEVKSLEILKSILA
jgi:DNA repair protein RecO (recombination protein O)